MPTVINLKNPRNRTNKIFLGEPLGIVNFADMKYPVFKVLYDEQWSFIWRPAEISLVRDVSDFARLNEAEKFVFEQNLRFQTLGDSLIGNGIDGILKYVTNNEISLSLKTHSTFESAIHTPSYSHIFENLYTDPSAQFYSILEDPALVSRAVESQERFDVLLNCEEKSPRIEIVNTLIALLAVESISFYNSFLTSFYFGKIGKMSGTASIIKLIARDESLHKSNSINLLKILMKEESEGFTDLRGYVEQKIPEAFKAMAEQEFTWIDHLMSHGELIGLSKIGLKTYVKYLTNRGLKEVGIKTPVFEDVENPFPWVKEWQSSSKSSQPAPQEQQLTNYTKSSTNDVDSMDFNF